MNMKRQLLLACLALGLLACKKTDHGGHDHDKESAKAVKQIAGPKGGKLLDNTAPRAEFLIEKDNRVTVTFYDAQLKPVPASGQVVAVIAEPKSGKVTLTLEAKDGAFVSKEPLPDGDGYNLVVQVKAAAGATPQNFRITFDLHTCGGCKLKEYACTCGH
ncbi:MAG: hypothetical protein EXS27_04855 [Pedosphaera sp.]|nr:hypothetical protein [Pedosphaera sp.]